MSITKPPSTIYSILLNDDVIPVTAWIVP